MGLFGRPHTFWPMRRSILYFASWRLVIASSSCGAFLEDRALLCSGTAETDRSGRSAGQTTGRETPRMDFSLSLSRTMSAPIAKACWENRRGLARRAVSKGKAGSSQIALTRFLVDVDLDRAGQERAPSLQISLYPRIADDPLTVELDDLMGVVFDLVDE